MILLVYKEAYFNTNDLDHIVPSATISLLQEFDNPPPPTILQIDYHHCGGKSIRLILYVELQFLTDHPIKGIQRR